MMIDWHELFAFTVSPLELMIRGTLVYLFLFVIFRTVLRRDLGAVGVADMLVVVMVADAAQNAMAAEYRSVSDGLVLLSTILGWDILLDYLSYKSARLRRLLQPPQLYLVRDGRINRRSLRREFITEDELRGKLREHGISDLAEVQAAYMESDGAVSVIRRRGAFAEDPQAAATRKKP
jgi:uncharacterized membrane protein YcaP (DUF421 family)